MKRRKRYYRFRNGELTSRLYYPSEVMSYSPWKLTKSEAKQHAITSHANSINYSMSEITTNLRYLDKIKATKV